MSATIRRRRPEPSAESRFLRHVARVDAALARLAAHRANHFGADPASLTWGDVGEVEELANKLEAAANFAGAPQ